MVASEFGQARREQRGAVDAVAAHQPADRRRLGVFAQALVVLEQLLHGPLVAGIGLQARPQQPRGAGRIAGEGEIARRRAPRRQIGGGLIQGRQIGVQRLRVPARPFQRAPDGELAQARAAHRGLVRGRGGDHGAAQQIGDPEHILPGTEGEPRGVAFQAGGLHHRRHGATEFGQAFEVEQFAIGLDHGGAITAALQLPQGRLQARVLGGQAPVRPDLDQGVAGVEVLAAAGPAQRAVGGELELVSPDQLQRGRPAEGGAHQRRAAVQDRRHQGREGLGIEGEAHDPRLPGPAPHRRQPAIEIDGPARQGAAQGGGERRRERHAGHLADGLHAPVARRLVGGDHQDGTGGPPGVVGLWKGLLQIEPGGAPQQQLRQGDHRACLGRLRQGLSGVGLSGRRPTARVVVVHVGLDQAEGPRRHQVIGLFRLGLPKAQGAFLQVFLQPLMSVALGVERLGGGPFGGARLAQSRLGLQRPLAVFLGCGGGDLELAAGLVAVLDRLGEAAKMAGELALAGGC